MKAVGPGSHRGDLLSLTADKPRVNPLPLILVAALVSGLILLWLIGDPILAGGFGAAVIGGGALIWLHAPPRRPPDSPSP